VKAVGEDILASLSRPYTLGAHEYRSTASIGAALFGVHRKGIEDLLKQGDIAMYQAKAKGRNNFCFFDPEIHEAIKARAAGSRFTERDRADVELHL
jgi:predicted signal transduction protein with EAL and GGDEF domain